MKASVILTTTSSLQDAKRISRILVEEKMAACCTIVPKVISVYRWKGAIETAEEFIVIIKTRETLTSGLMRRLKAIHPYDVPEMLVLEVSKGWPAYLKWIAECTEQITSAPQSL